MEENKLRHGSLFSGIGGFDLAAQWCGWENIFQVEIDDFCQKVLAKNFPNVKRFRDIKEFDGTKFRGAVDVLSGGFPCQPFSIAGKRKGNADDRALWHEMFRVIREIKPTFIVGENVAHFINMELRQSQIDLESEGYAVENFVLPACSLGAPHRRDRIWIVAHSDKIKCNATFPENCEVKINGFKKEIGNNSWIKFRLVAGTGYSQTDFYNGFNFEPTVIRNDDGIPDRLDRIRGLGNAIVPQIAYEIFKAISNMSKNHSVNIQQ